MIIGDIYFHDGKWRVHLNEFVEAFTEKEAKEKAQAIIKLCGEFKQKENSV